LASININGSQIDLWPAIFKLKNSTRRTYNHLFQKRKAAIDAVAPKPEITEEGVQLVNRNSI
jgi:hypothetical protein